MKISERDIEDWAVANLASIVGHDDAELLGRQLVLPSGRRVDLIATHPELHPGEHVLTIIEVKKNRADERDLCQLLGYMSEVHEIGASEVRGILLAPDFKPEVVRAAPGYGSTWVECRQVFAGLSLTPPAGYRVTRSWDWVYKIINEGRDYHDNPITDFLRTRNA